MNKVIVGFTALLTGSSLNAVTARTNAVYVPTENLSCSETIIKENQRVTETIKYISRERGIKKQTTQNLITDIVSQGYSVSAASTSNDEYVYDLYFGDGANEFWMAFSDKYPIKAYTVMDYVVMAMVDTKAEYGKLETDNDSDAFAHIYLVALITYKYGSSFAEEFLSFYKTGYNGSDMTNLNRQSMDLHNNPIGIQVGSNYRDYQHHMTGDVQKDLITYVKHVVKYGSYYGVLKLSANKMGFVNTTVGETCPLFPPFC